LGQARAVGDDKAEGHILDGASRGQDAPEARVRQRGRQRAHQRRRERQQQ